MKTGKEIALAAKSAGICEEWYMRMLKIGDIRPLCEMFFAGLDWAIEKDFPNLETLRRFKGNSEKYGLHTDFDGRIENQTNTAIFGNSHADIFAKDFEVKFITVRHNSILNIVASGNSIIEINVLDNAKVTVTAKENATVKVYNFSDKAEIETIGKVSFFKSEFKTDKIASRPITIAD